jgi:CHAD domain-containing protein
MLSLTEPRSGPTQFAPAEISPDDPVGAAVRAVLDDGAHWFAVNDVKARHGDVEGIHHLRTTTRRLRSALGMFRSLIDPDWSDAISIELKWLAGLLGAVRDVDVKTDRIRKAARAAAEKEKIEPLFTALATERAQTARALSQALRSDRYERLTESLSVDSLVIREDEDVSEPCRSALPRLVEPAWKSLKRLGRALVPSDPDEAFHDVRKRAKEARYTAEAAAGALDPDVSRRAHAFAKKIKQVQDVLGCHQDAVVASETVRNAISLSSDPGFSFAAGRIYERELAAANESREEFFTRWHELDCKKLRRWLKP